MKKSILFLLAAALLTGGALTAGSFAKDTSNALFEAHVEALMGDELCPGESDNCESGSERCLYYYDGRNYNIETKKNKR